MADDAEREQAVEAIRRAGRASRPKSSRTLWIVALLIGAVSVATFVVILFADTDAPFAPTRPHEGRAGFPTGVAIGVVAGIAIGYAIGRRRRSDEPSDRTSHQTE